MKLRAGETRELWLSCGSSGNGPVTVEIVTPFAHVTATPTQSMPQALYLSVTAPANFVGIDTIEYRGVDAGGPGPTTVGQIEVTSPDANDAPFCNRRPGTSLTTDKDSPVAALLVCDDPNEDAYTIEVATPPANGTIVSRPLEVNRIPEQIRGAQYVPNAGFVGTDTFAVRARDDRGALSPPYAFTVTVRGTIDPPAKPEPKPRVPAATTLRLGALPSLGRALRSGVPVTVTAGRAGTLGLRLVVDGRTARRLKLSRSGRPAVIASARTAMRAGNRRVVRLRFSKTAARRLRAVPRVRAQIVGSLGNVKVPTRTVTLRR